MKINKKQLRRIINEEVQKFEENNPSASDVSKIARGSAMRKDISGATGKGRGLIDRLQKLISHIGSTKVAPNAAVLTKLGHLEAALGIPTEQAAAAPEQAGVPPEQGDGK